MKRFLSHATFVIIAAFASAALYSQEPPRPAPPFQGFVHPGGLHTQADLDRIKAKVAAGQHPWIDDWNLLIVDPRAQNTWRSEPKPNMGVSRQRAQDDAAASYLNAMRWVISGDKSFADCAVRNLNSWSATVNQVPSGRDQPGLGGIPIGSFALAAEVLRAYPGWTEADQNRFNRMLLTYFYPVCDGFLSTHNGGGNSRFWANWDTANILAVMAIGVYCDDRPKFEQAVTYFKSGAGMGSIENAVPFLYPGGLGQWQESGRDHAHAMVGMGQLTEACQVAWNQGVDLFGYDHDRLLAGAEYEAQYTLWIGVPYTYYTNCDNANQYYISPGYHGRLEISHYELLYNHYVVLKGLNAPYVKLLAELKRPEPGNVDILGYGTLMFTLDAAASAYPALPVPPAPTDLTATAGLDRVDLKWAPSGAHSAQGYNVLRSTTPGGPYTSIYSTTIWTTPEYTDNKVVAGTTYHYCVAAINQSGTSGTSEPASAMPAGGGPLPARWSYWRVGNAATTGRATYASVANGSFLVDIAGAGIGGAADDCGYAHETATGDFTITAHLIDRNGPVNKMGLMMRENLEPDSRMAVMTLGEFGGRQARFGSRSSVGGMMAVQPGDDYTRPPVWFRLRRVGDVFSAFQSSDGASWFTVGTSTIGMPKTYLVGLAGCSEDKAGERATAAFDNVATSVSPPARPAAPSNLTAIASGANSIALEWKSHATNAAGFKVEASSDNVLFYEIADLAAGATSFMNTGLCDLATRHYRVRAYNTGGYSAYTNPASLAPPTKTAAR